MTRLLHCLVKEQVSWPLIGILAKAAASIVHNKAIQDFTKRKIESTIMTEPVITVAPDKAFLDPSKIVRSARISR